MHCKSCQLVRNWRSAVGTVLLSILALILVLVQSVRSVPLIGHRSIVNEPVDHSTQLDLMAFLAKLIPRMPVPIRWFWLN